MIRVIQIACIIATTALLYAVVSGVDALRYVVGEDYDGGVIAGVLYVIGLYLLICWIDPSSRPRGSGVQKQGLDNRVD
ncbi:hypothetical protein JOH51_000277 [Rhizobium leguminosarum]|nr:hypothetical protein [Rhizobium leguminosarum]